MYKPPYKKYCPPDQRASIPDKTALDNIKPVFHTNPGTPTADELMRPPVKPGEGTIRDTTPYMTTDDLPFNWLDLIRDVAAHGGSVSEFMVALGITRAGYETLLTTSPEFAEAVDRCLLLSRVWWEKTGRGLVTGQPGNGTVYINSMVNYWGWSSQKQDNTQTITAAVATKELTSDELDQELERRGLSIGLLNEKY